MKEKKSAVDRLGELLPELKGKIYNADYLHLENIYKEFSGEGPKDVIFSKKITVNYLSGILKSAKLYKTNFESKELFKEAIGIIREL